MSKQHIEVEGGELAIRNSYGDIAIVPKYDREKVQKMIDAGCNTCIDRYVSNLPRLQDYAADGSLYPDDPPKKSEPIYSGGTLPVAEVTDTLPNWLANKAKYEEYYDYEYPVKDFNKYEERFEKDEILEARNKARTKYVNDRVGYDILRINPRKQYKTHDEWVESFNDAQLEILMNSEHKNALLDSIWKRMYDNTLQKAKRLEQKGAKFSMQPMTGPTGVIPPTYTPNVLDAAIGTGLEGIGNILEYPYNAVQGIMDGNYSIGDWIKGYTPRNEDGVLGHIIKDPTTYIGLGILKNVAIRKAPRFVDDLIKSIGSKYNVVDSHIKTKALSKLRNDVKHVADLITDDSNIANLNSSHTSYLFQQIKDLIDYGGIEDVNAYNSIADVYNISNLDAFDVINDVVSKNHKVIKYNDNIKKYIEDRKALNIVRRKLIDEHPLRNFYKDLSYDEFTRNVLNKHTISNNFNIYDLLNKSIEDVSDSFLAFVHSKGETVNFLKNMDKYIDDPEIFNEFWEQYSTVQRGVVLSKSDFKKGYHNQMLTGKRIKGRNLGSGQHGDGLYVSNSHETTRAFSTSSSDDNIGVMAKLRMNIPAFENSNMSSRMKHKALKNAHGHSFNDPIVQNYYSTYSNDILNFAERRVHQTLIDEGAITFDIIEIALNKTIDPLIDSKRGYMGLKDALPEKGYFIHGDGTRILEESIANLSKTEKFEIIETVNKELKSIMNVDGNIIDIKDINNEIFNVTEDIYSNMNKVMHMNRHNMYSIKDRNTNLIKDLIRQYKKKLKGILPIALSTSVIGTAYENVHDILKRDKEFTKSLENVKTTSYNDAGYNELLNYTIYKDISDYVTTHWFELRRSDKLDDERINALVSDIINEYSKDELAKWTTIQLELQNTDRFMEIINKIKDNLK